MSTQTEVETLQQEIQKVQVTENFTQTESNVIPVKEISTQTNFTSTDKCSQTDSSNEIPKSLSQEISKKTTDAKEISIQTTSPVILRFLKNLSRIFSRWNYYKIYIFCRILRLFLKRKIG